MRHLGLWSELCTSRSSTCPNSLQLARRSRTLVYTLAAGLALATTFISPEPARCRPSVGRHGGAAGSTLIVTGPVSDIPWIHCSQPSAHRVARLRREVRRFRRAYNEQALRHLRRVVLCGRVGRGEHAWIRGIYDTSSATIMLEMDETDDTEYVLHHEFSSLLLHAATSARSFEGRWRRLTNSTYGMPYGRAAKYSWNTSERRLKRGFLHAYSETSFENDFNIMAAFYMSKYLRGRLKSASRYRKIRTKRDLVAEFMRPWLRESPHGSGA